MPISYQFDHSSVLLEVMATGSVTIADREEFVVTALADNELPAVTPVLINVSGIYNAPSVKDIPKMARLVEVLASRFQSRIAYYVTGVGIVTPYMLATQEVNDRIADACAFTDRGMAIKWLKGQLDNQP